MTNKKTYKDIFSGIYENFGFGSLESRSGPGSTIEQTDKLRKEILNLVKDKNIRSVVDIPCGDFNWMKEIVNEFEYYIGGDIVSEAVEINNLTYGSSKINFVEFDLIEDEIPYGDLLIVRNVIGHLPLEDGVKVIKNILKSNCKYLLSTTWAKKTNQGWDMCSGNDVDRENEGVNYGRFYPVNLMSPPFNFTMPEMILEENVTVDSFESGNRKVLALWDLSKLKKEINPENIVVTKKHFEQTKPYSKTTLVTGLWNLGRDNLGEGWSRSFQHYLDKFEQLLQVEENLIIYGDEELEKFVYEKRKNKNTQFVRRDLDWFKKNDYFELIQKIRNNPDWSNQVGWLSDSTQAKLEMYNPLVMSKMFLLHDAKILDKFNSEYLFWIDAGLTNTVHPGYFTHDKVIEKLEKYVSKFSFICFPYDAVTEIHGFNYEKINLLSGDKVNKVARGGFFGGPKESISNINSIYYNLLISTLGDGYMGTEESIFTIMCYKNSDLINYFEIEYNGLMGKFFEDTKEDRLIVKSERKNIEINNLDINKVGLYVITFNSPNQFRTLLKSMEEYDINILKRTKKYLLNNSTDESTTEEYISLCEEYEFEHIKKDNLGICGGRQWIAEHFDKETDLDYYIFSEDDMFFQNKPNETCRNGFNRYIDDFYNKVLRITKKENFDFLKFNFSEFYGDNGTQWSWYNVPQSVREEFWPEKPQLPKLGTDPNAPRTKFNNIKSLDGLPYVDGEIYYCNWTQLLSRTGNKKMFLDTTWAHPFENTWMSHHFQLTKRGELNGGLLLMTPVEHDRFEHYDGGLRKES